MVEDKKPSHATVPLRGFLWFNNSTQGLVLDTVSQTVLQSLPDKKEIFLQINKLQEV